MNSLDFDTITKLLAGEQTPTEKDRVRPIQIGPLRWRDETERCTSRGCSSPTFIRIEGIPYCTTHALNALNRICIDNDPLVNFRVDDCECDSGRRTMMNIHTQDCPVFAYIKGIKDGKEYSDSNKSSPTESADAANTGA